MVWPQTDNVIIIIIDGRRSRTSLVRHCEQTAASLIPFDIYISTREIQQRSSIVSRHRSNWTAVLATFTEPLHVFVSRELQPYNNN